MPWGPSGLGEIKECIEGGRKERGGEGRRREEGEGKRREEGEGRRRAQK